MDFRRKFGLWIAYLNKRVRRTKIGSKIFVRFPGVEYVLTIVSAVLVLLGIIWFLSQDDQERVAVSSSLSVISNIATAVAIIWIVYNSWMQQQLIAMQRTANRATATASELDSFLKLLDHVERAICYDARSLIKIFCDENGLNTIEALDTAYSAGDRDSYYRFISHESDFSNWLTDSMAGDRAVTIASTCNSAHRKHRTLIEAAQRLSEDNAVHSTIIDSSALSHAMRVFQPILNVKSLSYSSDPRVIT